MRYALHVTINRLDGTTEEKASELPALDELIDAVYHMVREHEGFAASLVFTVVPKR